MSITHKNHGATTTTASTKDRFHDYLTKLGITEDTKLTHSQLKQIFVTVVRDFKNKEIDIDQLSGISYILLSYMSNMDQFSTDLGDVLLVSLDANCPLCSDRHEDIMEEINNYFKKHSVLSLD